MRKKVLLALCVFVLIPSAPLAASQASNQPATAQRPSSTWPPIGWPGVPNRK